MGMLEDALREYAKYDDRSTDPATPAAGEGLIYFKDGKIHSIDDAGTVIEYGAGGGGGGSVEVAVDRVETSQSTTSGSYTDLTTPGPAVTITVPASGIAVVSISANVANSTQTAAMSFAMSGANTAAASDDHRINIWGSGEDVGRTVVLTGLSTGSTTFTAKYRQGAGGTAIFGRRELSVMVGLTAA